MRAVRVLVGLAAATGVLAGGGVARGDGTTGAPGLYAPAAVNRAAARRDAPALLAMLHLPAGATATATDPTPGALLGRPVQDSVSPNLVDADAFWTTSATPAAVLAAVTARLPAAIRHGSRGSTGGSDGQASRFWSAAPAPGLAQRIVGVQVAPLPDGMTAVRLDGEATWLTPRPRWQRLPASVSRLRFSGHGATAHGDAGPTSQTVTVTRPAAVRRIVTYLNALRPVQPGVYACPADLDISTTVRLYGRGRRLLGRAVDGPTGCASVGLTVGGRTGPSLADGSSGAGTGPPSLTAALATVGAIARCTPAQLSISAAEPDESSDVVFTGVNRSRAICALHGFATVGLRGAAGHALPVRDRHAATDGVRPPAAIVYPRTSAQFSVSGGDCRSARAAAARVTLPGSAAVTVPLTGLAHPLRACGRVLTVSPLGSVL